MMIISMFYDRTVKIDRIEFILVSCKLLQNDQRKNFCRKNEKKKSATSISVISHLENLLYIQILLKTKESTNQIDLWSESYWSRSIWIVFDYDHIFVPIKNRPLKQGFTVFFRNKCYLIEEKSMIIFLIL